MRQIERDHESGKSARELFKLLERRDRAMVELHALFPQYGFPRHKGYASQLHLAALREHGPCPPPSKSPTQLVRWR